MARSPRIKPAFLKAFVVAFVNSTAVLCTALLVAAMGQDGGMGPSKTVTPSTPETVTPPPADTGASPPADTGAPRPADTGASRPADTATPSPAVTPGVRFENLYVVESGGQASEAWPLGCHFHTAGSVYPFGLGKAELERGEEGENAVNSAAEVKRTMMAVARDHVLVALVLVGRVDRVPFDAHGEGQNMTLAMKRIEWFREWALEEMHGEVDGIGTAVGGAARIPAGPLDLPSKEDCPGEKNLECDAPERQRHRSVDVFACWVPKPGREESVPTADKSEIS